MCLGESLTILPSWNHVTFGVGSAVMRHSKSNRLPSSSCLIAGFFAKVGAIPSICLQVRIKKFKVDEKFIFSIVKYHTSNVTSKINYLLSSFLLYRKRTYYNVGKCRLVVSRTSRYLVKRAKIHKTLQHDTFASKNTSLLPLYYVMHNVARKKIIHTDKTERTHVCSSNVP